VVLNEQDGLHVQDKGDGVPMVLEEHNSRHVAAGSDLTCWVRVAAPSKGMGRLLKKREQ
jgi:hypothetical protein